MDHPPQGIKLYRFALSGHCHRVELLLSILGLPAERIDVDLARGEQRSPWFLAMNPFGQVPVLVDGAATLADSCAILAYLAERYGGDAWRLGSPLEVARIQHWLSVAAGPLAYGPCTARLVTLFKQPHNLKEAIDRSRTLLRLMNEHLSGTAFLAGDRPTIADIANYTYVAHAPEGNVALDPYRHLAAWLARVEALPGFVAMPASAVGLRVRKGMEVMG